MTTPIGYYPIELFIPHFESLDHHFPIDDAVVLDRLAWRADAQIAFEVGTFVGLTASIIAKHSSKTVCFDIWRATESDDPINEIYRRHPDVMGICQSNLKWHIEEGRVGLIQVPEGQHWSTISRYSPQLIFLDGDHSYETVKRDIQAALHVIWNGGILCGHDYGTFEGVTRAVDELLPDAKKRGTMWWVEL